MKKILLSLSLVLLVTAGCSKNSNTQTSTQSPTPTPQQETKSMTLTSPDFGSGDPIPVQYSCKGKNFNPPLTIHDVPANTQSIALVLHDPDAPVAGGFTHWVIYNLDPHTTDILTNVIPAGSTQGKNGSGKTGYTGPCPPSGTHHYHFTVYALDTKLDLKDADKTQLEQAMQNHIVSQAELVGTFAH